MDNIREKINKIDKKIMTLLEERFNLSNEIGKIKCEKNTGIVDLFREGEILAKVKNFKYQNPIKDVYKLILKKSKNVQTKYGLVGKKISYSISPLVYKRLGINYYNIVEFNDFKEIEDLDYFCLNITIPYKADAYNYSKSLDESAIVTKTVNTLIGDKGYNTDYLAFKDIIKYHNLNLVGKKIIIIGNGATSRSVKAAIETDAVFLVRTIRDDNEYYLHSYVDFLDADYIINTTPYGAYPNLETRPIFPLINFKNLKMVIDVIYNPLNSPLIIEAKKYNIKTMNGLELLIRQANLSYNLMFNKNVNKSDEILKDLNKRLHNIVLIGMPYSGKTTVAKTLANTLNKELVDIDDILELRNIDLNTLTVDNISLFREYEKKVAIKYSGNYNQVISTGGGLVESKEAMEALKINGLIIFINTPVEKLIERIDGTRPLIKNEKDLLEIYKKRISLYKRYNDIEVTSDDANTIMEKINEYFSN